jgi:hypothetical protein
VRGEAEVLKLGTKKNVSALIMNTPFDPLRSMTIQLEQMMVQILREYGYKSMTSLWITLVPLKQKIPSIQACSYSDKEIVLASTLETAISKHRINH